MCTFRKYLCLELLVWIYLGCWNVTVPLIIVQRGSLLELVAYETALAFAAIVSMLFFASRVESMRRSTALKVGCVAVLLTGVLRYLLVSVSYSLHALILIDVLAASAFGVVQPLFGVYPAETVKKHRIEHAFRIRRIIATLGSMVGPLLAGVVIAAFSLQISLLVAVVMGMAAVVFAIALPESAEPNTQVVKTPIERIQGMFLGIKLKFILPPERFLTLSGFLLNLSVTATVPMLVPDLIHTRNLAEGSAGLLNATFAGGAIGGLFFFSPLIAKKENQRGKYIGLWALLTAALCACSHAAGVWQLAPWLFFAGAASACLSLVGMDKRTASIPSGFRIRIIAATLVVGQLANSASYLVAGAIMPQFGARGLLWLYLAIFIIVAVYSMLSKSVWHFLKDTVDADLYYPNNHPELAAAFSSPQRAE